MKILNILKSCFCKLSKEVWLSLDWSIACIIKIIFLLDDKIKKLNSVSSDVLLKVCGVETNDCLIQSLEFITVAMIKHRMSFY